MFRLPVFHTDQLGYRIPYEEAKKLRTVLAEPLADITAVLRITGWRGREGGG